MFPIVFAAISGRSMKMIARYLAEKGTRIGVSMDVVEHKTDRTDLFSDA